MTIAATQTALEPGAEDPKAFYDGLLAELSKRRETLSPAEQNFGADKPLGRAELVEWLKFQAWYEREAAVFIGSWLRDTHETEAFLGLCRQIADEGRHYKLCLSQLAAMGESLEGWEPEPEWVEWVQVFYAAGDDTLERVSAHNITGEIGAMQAFESMAPRVPDAVNHMIDKIMPDEKFHVSLGRMVVHRYATTVDAQARIRKRVFRAFELEQAGRVAYDRRISALAA